MPKFMTIFAVPGSSQEVLNPNILLTIMHENFVAFSPGCSGLAYIVVWISVSGTTRLKDSHVFM